ncbi:MAG: magnesium transporter [Rhodanobacteraceae bacterium]
MENSQVSADQLRTLDATDAAARLANESDSAIVESLQALGSARAVAILGRFSPKLRARVVAHAGAEGRQWLSDRDWPAHSVGRLIELTPGTFNAETTVGDIIAALRPVLSHTLISYIYVVDGDQRLLGVVAFRELAFARANQTLDEIMLREPFALHPETRVIDAMREVVSRHYPVYPVCDGERRLLGVVRGSTLFEQQAYEISAQAGSMVGVEKEERLTTPWARSLRFRLPWLQLNLFTAFVAGAVVGVFQGTINRVVLLAVFLPVLSGQCSNTGCQALAVTLRGMTLGEMDGRAASSLLWKETWLGFVNGALTGLLAAVGMYLLANHQQQSNALWLAVVTFVAMTGSCAMSGFAGAGVPLMLKRFGADPATASSIFLTTATDVVSMGLFLGLAAWLVSD